MYNKSLNIKSDQRPTTTPKETKTQTPTKKKQKQNPCLMIDKQKSGNIPKTHSKACKQAPDTEPIRSNKELVPLSTHSENRANQGD